MRSQTISFPDRKTLCIFPNERSDLEEALPELNLESGYPVIVLIGGAIDTLQADATMRAIETIARLAHEMKILIICGGTDMGVMAKIGQVRSQNTYTFPLVGMTLEDLVTWPDGPQSTKFLWWGRERWQLEPHYPYFILVPGSHFGDESPWIVEAASIFSKDNQSVTILINGGEISRKDIQLSLEEGRSVIALSHTGRLADEISQNFERNGLITVISANADERIVEAIRSILRIDQTHVVN
jgi:SLOG in TRPM, prokaryote